MKYLYTLLAILFLNPQGFCQAPQKLSYQAIIRDAGNNLISNGNVGLQIQIVQGSIFGPSVYVESHQGITNGNGLLTLEIGDGFVVLGDFSQIDWSSGPYYLKTEIDPLGGTNYVITGITELLSVVYSLHAEVADSVIGGVVETDPVFSSSIAEGITQTDTSFWNQHTIDTDTHIDSVGIVGYGFTAGPHSVNTDSQQLMINGDTLLLTNGGFIVLPSDSFNVYTAGTGINISNNIISTNSTAGTYAIGDIAFGGIVFWVDESGQHGLVCYKEDLPHLVWFRPTPEMVYADGDGIYAGKKNTTVLRSLDDGFEPWPSGGQCAACEVFRFVDGVNGIPYGDWYLPSRMELNFLYQQKNIVDSVALSIGGASFANDYYWSSTEYDQSLAYRQHMNIGGITVYVKQHPHRIRPIRSF